MANSTRNVDSDAQDGNLGVKINLEVARTWYQEAAGVATDTPNGG